MIHSTLDFEQSVARTLVTEPGFVLSNDEIMLVWNALGLAGESGEVCDLIKKGIFHRKGVDLDKLKKELGDVLWYTTATIRRIKSSLLEVMQINDEKLLARYPNGFDASRSHEFGATAIEEQKS